MLLQACTWPVRKEDLCAAQVSDHLEFGQEDSDEAKTAALASILAVGEVVRVKVVEVAFDERCASS